MRSPTFPGLPADFFDRTRRMTRADIQALADAARAVAVQCDDPALQRVAAAIVARLRRDYPTWV
jgi:hypothetical protein